MKSGQVHPKFIPLNPISISQKSGHKSCWPSSPPAITNHHQPSPATGDGLLQLSLDLLLPRDAFGHGFAAHHLLAPQSSLWSTANSVLSPAKMTGWPAKMMFKQQKLCFKDQKLRNPPAKWIGWVGQSAFLLCGGSLYRGVGATPFNGIRKCDFTWPISNSPTCMAGHLVMQVSRLPFHQLMYPNIHV